MPSTVSTTSHLSGNVIVIGERMIQRCLICGEKLSDNVGLLKSIENREGGSFHAWPVGAWIQFREGGKYASVTGQTDGPDVSRCEVPLDCCIELVEE